VIEFGGDRVFLKFGIGFPAEADSKTVCTTWVG
jgi:hypothetical protein